MSLQIVKLEYLVTPPTQTSNGRSCQPCGYRPALFKKLLLIDTFHLAGLLLLLLPLYILHYLLLRKVLAYPLPSAATDLRSSIIIETFVD